MNGRLLGGFKETHHVGAHPSTSKHGLALRPLKQEAILAFSVLTVWSEKDIGDYLVPHGLLCKAGKSKAPRGPALDVSGP